MEIEFLYTRIWLQRFIRTELFHTGRYAMVPTTAGHRKQ